MEKISEREALDLIRATATRSVPNCINLPAIDRILVNVAAPVVAPATGEAAGRDQVNTFCEKAGHVCTDTMCDNNGCGERVRHYVPAVAPATGVVGASLREAAAYVERADPAGRIQAGRPFAAAVEAVALALRERAALTVTPAPVVAAEAGPQKLSLADSKWVFCAATPELKQRVNELLATAGLAIPEDNRGPRYKYVLWNGNTIDALYSDWTKPSWGYQVVDFTELERMVAEYKLLPAAPQPTPL